jgi:hypothetical protein
LEEIDACASAGGGSVMTNLKKRLLGAIVGGIVGAATVGGIGVALASNGDRSGATTVTTTPAPGSTSDVRGTDGRGEREPGEDQGRHDEPGEDQGEHGDNSGPGGDQQGEHGDNSGPGGDQQGEPQDTSDND